MQLAICPPPPETRSSRHRSVPRRRRRRGGERGSAEVAAEAERESIDDVVTENKGAGQAKKKSKRREKKVRQRAKVFRESTAELVEVRTLEMVMEFKPMPDQVVVLKVSEDVGSWEFVTIMEYAEDVGYRIQNQRELILMFLKQRMEELKRRAPPPSLRRWQRAEDGSKSSESTSYSSTHSVSDSRGSCGLPGAGHT